MGPRGIELELSPRVMIHSVFYVGLLEPYRESTDPTSKDAPTLPDVGDDQPSYVVERIVNSQYYGPTKRTC
jgi:hypothetical protein